MKTPQVTGGLEIGTIKAVEVLHGRGKAAILAKLLNEESDDGWTYTVEARGELRAVVIAYDETGKRIGVL